jgi:hypothetical protein
MFNIFTFRKITELLSFNISHMMFIDVCLLRECDKHKAHLSVVWFTKYHFVSSKIYRVLNGRIILNAGCRSGHHLF